eukprot:2463483-Rhodomonas_salina.1
MSRTDLGHAPTHARACYTMSGTGVAYGATIILCGVRRDPAHRAHLETAQCTRGEINANPMRARTLCTMKEGDSI